MTKPDLAPGKAQAGGTTRRDGHATDGERRQLVDDWNATATPYPRDACVHELFEAQTARTPDAVAVVCGNTRLTYRALNARANQLAHRLSGLGRAPASPVLVHVPRSIDFIVSVLAILKTGAAYVPLDTGDPIERLRWLAADTGATVLVACMGATPDLQITSLEVVLVDEDAPHLEGQPETNLPPRTTADGLAYIMYTSGSTGRPKGVLIPHRAIVRLVCGAPYAPFDPPQRFLLLASPAFDASTYELWGPLLNGATCVVAPAPRLDLDELGRQLADQQITNLWLTSSLFNAVVDDAADRLASLSHLMIGGEALSIDHVRRFRAAHPNVVLVNGYGPTESTTFTCTYPIPATLAASARTVPIGRPIANTTVYVLDEAQQLVPIGVPGELYIGGDGLALGYLHRPELTAQKFIPDPFATAPGGRLYRTGDQVRWRADGYLEFLGRLDHQVKLRGFRIELGEIEAVLRQHPDVREAVVLMREDRPGDPRLVAYVVAFTSHAPVTAAVLRPFLSARLPEYMVPSAFVRVDRLPLGPTGKLDRRALPASELDRTHLEQTYAAPRTPIEQRLAEIWSSVLSVPQVGVRDNFFELGGHSLLATRVLSRVGDVFEISLPVRELFEAPTVAELAARIEAFPSGTSAIVRLPLAPRLPAEAAPLSFAQERLWFLHQLDPASAAYNITWGRRLQGLLNVSALERSLREVVRRHEALRTTFASGDGQPQPVLQDAAGFVLTITDLPSLPETERASETGRAAARAAARPFDLSRDLMLRGDLLSFTNQDHVLVLTMHHIASDGWSLEVFDQELTALYDAYDSDRPSPLPELPIQYGDYAIWQRTWLQGAVLDEQLAYWTRQLAGAPALLALPTDFPRPSVQSHRGAQLPVVWDRTLTAAVDDLSRREHVTPFMTLLAAFQVLLSRYTGQTDISVGAPIAGRNRTDLEALIGFFVNTLVLRTDLGGNPTFREVLARVREVTLGAFAHQDVPFERVVDALRPERDLSRNPLVQVLLVLDNEPESPLVLRGLEGRSIEIDHTTAKFDLTLSLGERDGQFRGTLEYRTDLFQRETMARLLEHLHVLLSGIVAEPGQRIDELPLLTAGERRQIVEDWNATGTPYPRDSCVHERFEAQAARTPDALAVVDGDTRLTYRELNARANRLAHGLCELGVAPGRPVLVHLPRSLDFIVSVLAILKTGAAYMPLDPGDPIERLRWLAADARATVLVSWTGASLDLQLPGLEVVLVDDAPHLQHQQDTDLPRCTTADDLAYIMYTSGSTGQPKGVMIPHRAILRLVCDARYAPFGPPQRFLLLASPAFDASTYELWGPLLNGSTCVVYPAPRLDLDDLGRQLAGQQITTLWLTSSLFNAVVDHAAERLAGLSHLMIGGEALSIDHVRRFRAAYPDIALVNGYGPTESTTFACTYPIPPAIAADATAIPIGRPIANTTVYVLDEARHLVPIGVPGELYIGGDGLALGYLNQPELTAQKFIPDPFSTVPGARLYRTGDQVRWRTDGTLDFLGRLDHQIKLRGFRIELGEIESVVRQHPAVREAVVLLREDRPGDPRLVAYVEPRTPDVSVTAAALGPFLSGRLPEYMVPSAIVPIDTFPFGATGKIDRRALPAPEFERTRFEQIYTAPRTATEQRLVGIWRDLLAMDQVGINDNFFQLGGHSLLATRVMSRVGDAFVISVPVRHLFEAPTVAQLATRIEALQRDTSAIARPPLGPRPPDHPTPLSFAQERLWFLDQLEPVSAVYNVPWAVRLHGPLNVPALEQSLQEVLRRHETLRTHFTSVDGTPHPVLNDEALFRLAVTDLRPLDDAARAARLSQLIQEEANRPFDLARDLMLRGRCVQLADQDHVLVLTMHHIASDGWSLEVFAQELTVLYDAFAQGRPSPLPDLPIQYADYAVWQRAWLAGEALERQLAYWRARLADAPPVLPLPIDFPRPAVQQHRGAQESIECDRQQSQALAELARQAGVTPFMLLLAAFQVLLARYTGQTDISVGAPIAGRTRTELEGLIGFFVNTLVLRTDLAGNPTFRDVLARVREVTLGAYAHQDVPFEKLVEVLRPQRHLATTPLFQVMFVLENAPARSVALGGLSATPIAIESTTAKFDLTLALGERDGQLHGRLEYDTDLFAPATVRGLLAYFRALLEQVVADPDQRLDDLTRLTAAEWQQIVVAWNRTGSEAPRHPCVPDWVEAQVARTPDACAVSCGGATLTYARLDAQANQLAHALIGLGVGPDVLVGVYLNRSLDLVVALLAILKAAGGYVPLDPAYPPERIGLMLQDCAAPVVLTTQALQPTLPAHTARVVCLDAVWPARDAAPETAPPRAVTPANLAYVIYTSGSTGRPKGVAIEHRNVTALIQWALTVFTPTELAGVLAATSICFDLSVFELFVPLSAGGGVVLVEHALALVTVPPTPPVTLINTVPSAMAELLRLRAVPASVVTVNLAGEALPTSLVDAIYRQTHVQRVYDLYGPSEDTTYSTYALRAPEAPATIGRPIADTQAYVLDPVGHAVPVGVAGELYLGGAGVVRGYLHQPALTAERFLPDPFTSVPGGRLYRTGDQVRWRADGTLEFLGRLDHQVKLRGFRIELGEIETALRQHSEVREAVVLLREDRPGDPRLVAYVVAHTPDAAVPAAALRLFLRAQLPEYMVPSAFVLVDRFPLGPTGKLDRRALPAPELDRTHLEQSYTAPRTPVEQQLAEIWSNLLGVAQVGIDDNFFELGGHSLLATRVMSRVGHAFEITVPVRHLFEAPTVAQLATRLEALPRDPSASTRLPLGPRPTDCDVPLSFAQERLWFLDQFEPVSAVYNVPWAVRLHGPLNVPALERSLSEVIRRHETLRTHFTSVGGTPQPVLDERAVFRLDVTDLRHLDEAARAVRLPRLIQEESSRPFDLSRDLMLRGRCIALADWDHVLVLTMHHIASDGWSLGVFAEELTAVYDAFSNDRPSPLPELPIQYGDYAIWQRTWLQGSVLDAQLAYWTRQLAGAPALLALPTDFPRPAVQSHRGAQLPVVWDRTLTAAVDALSRREHVTPFMTLLAAFQVLLSRYTGQTDISVGAPIAGRNRTDLEGLIGFFVNTLVLRTDLGGNPTFREVLARVREVTLGAYAHQDIPFERVVEVLQPDRDLSRTPLVQVLLVLDNEPESPLVLRGLEGRSIEIDHTTAKFDLTLSLGERDGQFRGTLEYRTDLFQRETMARLLEHLHVLLSGIVAEPGQRIDELPLLTAGERRQIVEDWNATGTPYPRDACVHEQFEAQTARTPDALAVVCGDTRLTYRELNARANRLAHGLCELGVAPGRPVLVHVPRSLDFIVSVLAILKAGAAYVPLDPGDPIERWRWLAADTGATVLVSAGDAPELQRSGLAVVRVDDVALSLAAQPETDLPRCTTADDLAYIMYTSGSTGQPKGVMIPHRAILRLVCGARYAPFGPPQRFLLLASPAFDASTYELWGPLLNGSTCVVYAAPRLDLDDLGRQLADQQVTTLWLTSSLFNAVVDHAADRLAGLSHLMIGGEALSIDHVRRFRAAYPDIALVNGYGPTESTTFTCTYPIPSALAAETTAVSIGRPIANTTVYVLDEARHLVPIGVPGELYIGGDGLALGYLNQPELTEQKFIPDPFATVPGARLYRTGDQVRWRTDGTLDFLGRRDDQVKLRGFRIELGEIESVLRQHPHVREAVVVLRTDPPGDPRLVAYVAPRTPDALATMATLRPFLSGRLPEYMVPSAIVAVDTFPFGPTGKLDRRALPAPEFERSLSAGMDVSPRTPVEQRLADIWSSVLNVPQVGVHDNFFELGGHSLLATRVMSRVGDAFVISVPVRHLFEAPTVAQLATRIEALQRDTSAIARPPLGPRPPDRPTPLSFAQERLWFLDQLEPVSAVYNIPWVVRLHGPLNLPALEQSLQEVVRRHETLRTDFTSVSGAPLPVLDDRAVFRLAVTDLRPLDAAAQAAQLIQEEANRPFDLARDLMLRGRCVQLAEQDHVLVLTMHHIASDGWSLEVFAQELTVLYDAFTSGRPSPLPDLPIQYADYAVWQRAWLAGEALERQLAYWRARLADAPPVLPLPIDFPRPAVQQHRGAQESIECDRQQSQALAELARRAGVTPFMLLLAAFQVLLARYTGQTDISVGAPIAGRTRTELEGLIGFFVNTLVLRTDLAGNPTFRDVLARVREVTLGAYAHQDVPFEKLVEVLRPQRNLATTPLFQVMFVLENDPAPAVALRGITVTPMASDSTTAKFDLTLALGEKDGQLCGQLEYDTDLFAPATVRGLLAYFRALLEQVVADPDQRLDDLTRLTAAEWQQIVVAWNQTGTEPARHACVHAWVEAQVARTPDARAVACGAATLTYAELNGQANRLAHALIGLGVGPDVLVGVYLDRSVDLVVALLAILKAGGGYVPLDPAYPSERIGVMLQDCAAPVVLTTQALQPTLPAHAARVVCLDAAWPARDAAPSTPPPGAATAESLAYVIYTSGSTGRPKGVAIEHRNVTALLQWALGVFTPAELAGVLAATSICFDLSVFELFVPLSAGGAVVLVDHALALMTVPPAPPVTLINTVPSAMAELLRLGAVPDSVVTVNLAGEALPTSLVDAIYRETHVQRVYDLYGPSEDTTYSTYALRAPEAPATIGRPIAHTQAYVLDPAGHPVPVGVAGELYLGGAGVARGYLHQAVLTAEKFVPDPFAATPGARLYRTGDQVRWRADGTLEFLGRLDHQVKLRGFRIELGEIETVLRQHAQVREAVVLVREDRPGDPRLVAYCVPAAPHEEVVTSVLRSYLHTRLPDYMVPGAFIVLERLPLTIGGKIDRRALPAPVEIRPGAEAHFIGPHTDTEARLARLWCEALGIPDIGVHDDFFDLGGHSLLALRLLHKIEQEFQSHVSLKDFFRGPTISDQAARLARRRPTTTRASLVEVRAPLDAMEAARPPLLISPSLFGYVDEWQALFRGSPFNRAVYGIEFHGNTAYATEHPTLEQIASDMVGVIAERFDGTPVHLAGHSFGALLSYELARQLSDGATEARAIVMVDAEADGHLPDEKFTVRDFLSMGANAPYWLVNELRVYGWVGLWKRLMRRVAPTASESPELQIEAASPDGDPHAVEHLKQIFDWPTLPTLYRQRLSQGYNAIANYQTRPTRNRIVYLQSRVRTLIHRYRPDGGWSRHAPADGLRTYRIPGDHGSPFHERWRPKFVAVLQRALNTADDEARG